MSSMYDVKVEAGVIGSLLRNPSFYYHFEQMKPKFFHDEIYQVLFYVIQTTLQDGSEDVSDFSIYLRITGEPKLEKVFTKKGVEIQDIIDKLKNVGTEDAEEYKIRCKKVVDYAFKRDSTAKLKHLANEIENGDYTANEANMKIHDNIDKFSEQYIIGGDIKLIGDVIDDIWGEVEDRWDSGQEFSGLPSKFPKVNSYFTYEKGEVVIVGGRAKSGKSFFAINEAIHKLKNGVPTGIIDTELGTRETIIRMVANLTQIDNRRLKSGSLTKEEKEKAIMAKKWLKEQPFFHQYKSDWSLDDMYITTKELQKKMNLGFLIIDYLKATNIGKENIQEHNILGNKMDFVKNQIAGKLDIPILTFGQLSPTSNRLADSDKLNRYSSVVAYFIEKTPEQIAEDGSEGGNRAFIIDYNRLGEQFENGERINLHFHGNTSTIVEAKKQYIGDAEIFGANK